MSPEATESPETQEPPAQPTPADDDLPFHRVAVAVFVEARGVDLSDASSVAEFAVRRTLFEHASHVEDHCATIHVDTRRGPEDVLVVDVTDVGVAAGNGHLWLRPTSRPYRDAGRPPLDELNRRE